MEYSRFSFPILVSPDQNHVTSLQKILERSVTSVHRFTGVVISAAPLLNKGFRHGYRPLYTIYLRPKVSCGYTLPTLEKICWELGALVAGLIKAPESVRYWIWEFHGSSRRYLTEAR